MRRVLLSMVFMFAFLSVNALFAETKTLIDFNQYEQKLASDPAYKKASSKGQKGGVPDALDPAYSVDPKDMSIDHWIVSLNSGSRQMENVKYSYVKKVKTKGKVGGGPRTVLGARIHFPSWNNNSYALISPPYEFPTYTEEGKPASETNGVVSNVGEIYSITAEVYGRNFQHSFFIQLRNEKGEVEKYNMGHVFFNGWRKLTWRNPMYIDNVDLRAITRMPIFPDQGVPYKKLDSFMIFRDGNNAGGNFLIYIANVTIKYDLAIVSPDEDIDQEGTWHILKDILSKKALTANRAQAELVELRKEELKKMAVARDGSGGPAVDNKSSGSSGGGAKPKTAAAPAGK